MKTKLLVISSFLLSVLYIVAEENRENKTLQRYVFIELVSSNVVEAVVSMHRNIEQTRTGGIYVSTNSFLRLFSFNENKFGERWILEGWAEDSSEKEILYDTHNAFKDALLKREAAKKARLQISNEKFLQMQQSNDPEEKERALEISRLTWDMGGGSWRRVNRARDITIDRNIPIKNLIDVEKLQLKDGRAVRYLQLRIEPLDTYEPHPHMWGSTNKLEALYSNIIELEANK